MALVGKGCFLELLPIAPGRFSMGSPDDEQGRFGDEPLHEVVITRPYWLGRTEVTQRQWEALIGDNPSHFKGAEQPVTFVDWESCSEFCRRLTERERAFGRLPEGSAFGLPTEAQWEYAARAGTTGLHAGDLDAAAWYDKNSSSQSRDVGRKQRNAWRLYDMHGNVGEWCLDGYGEYPAGPGSDPSGTVSGPGRVERGGSWLNTSNRCRSASRNFHAPGVKLVCLGFRVALAWPPVGPRAPVIRSPDSGNRLLFLLLVLVSAGAVIFGLWRKAA